MDASKVAKDLRAVQQRYKDAVTSTGGVNMSAMAQDAADCIEELEREVETLRTACAEKDGVMAFVECALQAFFSLSSTERKALSDNWMLTVARKLEEGIALSPASVQEQAEYARIGRAVSNTDWVRNASDEAFLEKMRPGYTLALKHLQAVIEQARKGERRG